MTVRSAPHMSPSPPEIAHTQGGSPRSKPAIQLLLVLWVIGAMIAYLRQFSDIIWRLAAQLGLGG